MMIRLPVYVWQPWICHARTLAPSSTGGGGKGLSTVGGTAPGWCGLTPALTGPPPQTLAEKEAASRRVRLNAGLGSSRISMNHGKPDSNYDSNGRKHQIKETCLVAKQGPYAAAV